MCFHLVSKTDDRAAVLKVPRGEGGGGARGYRTARRGHSDIREREGEREREREREREGERERG